MLGIVSEAFSPRKLHETGHSLNQTSLLSSYFHSWQPNPEFTLIVPAVVDVKVIGATRLNSKLRGGNASVISYLDGEGRGEPTWTSDGFTRM